MNDIINISGYKFVNLPLEKLSTLQSELKQAAIENEVKGTILLSTEGINAFMAGTKKAIDAYQAFIHRYPEFEDLWFKESPSQSVPFNRLLVRIKKEIIAMGCATVEPEKSTAPYIEPEELQRWYDEKRDFVILDTRNDYEVAIGTFDNAVDLNIENFREFPDAIGLLPDEVKEKPVVTFCTGGIRCEKAAAWMQEKGFKNVYQLNGGILNYFEKSGGEHYHGDCFVFDKRLTVNSKLNATNTSTCYAHRQSENVDCPYCQHIKTSRATENHA